MIAQFIFTVLFILVSYGMKTSSESEEKKFPSGDYVIVGANQNELVQDSGRFVHFEKKDKQIPRLILQKFREDEQRVASISMKLINGKQKIFVEGNTILDTIGYEDGTPQIVLWEKINAEESFVVLAKEGANLLSLLSNKEWLNKLKTLTQNLNQYNGWTYENRDTMNENPKSTTLKPEALEFKPKSVVSDQNQQEVKKEIVVKREKKDNTEPHAEEQKMDLYDHEYWFDSKNPKTTEEVFPKLDSYELDEQTEDPNFPQLKVNKKIVKFVNSKWNKNKKWI